MKHVNRILVLFALAVLVVGCASTNLPEPEHEPRPGTQMNGNVDSTEDMATEVGDRESTSEADEITNKANEIDAVSARHSGDVVALTLDQKILFELGKAEIKRSAWPTLDEIAKLIAEYPERMVMVQGYTDDLPTRTERFPSNWDLSAQRAVNVVKYIANLPGLDKSRLVAAGLGEYHPRVPNTSPENRQLNRRVEIVLYPSDLPEITVPVPQP